MECQQEVVHKYLNFCFARMEIIHFVQHSVLKKRKNCVTICTTKKRSSSKANNQIICDRNEMINSKKAEKIKSLQTHIRK